MTARIYRQTKNPMQSGTANARKWVLDYEPAIAREIDPLMGWTSSRDMNAQLKLKFVTCDDAVAYAERHNIAYTILPEHKRRRVLKTYADNFKG